MTNEPLPTPYLDPEPGRYGAAPHLSDYWQVIARRLWLVLVIFTATTASSIWAISRQEIYYQSSMSLQVNDPLERQRGLVSQARIGGLDIFVDPIESEIQVLTSTTIALSVVDSLGMRLTPADPSRMRSELGLGVRVLPEAPNGSFRLIYDAAGTSARFLSSDGSELATAPVGSVLDAGFVRFTLQAPPTETRGYELDLLPATRVMGEIALTTSRRDQTNIIDVALIHGDPVLVVEMLNQSGHALRAKGAEGVRQQAEDEMEFIREQLDSAGSKLSTSRDAIRQFKQTAAFTTLSSREQRLVTQTEALTTRIQQWDDQRKVLTGLTQTLDDMGVAQADLAGVLAALPQGTNDQVRILINQIQSLQADERALVSQEQLAADHPRVIATRAEIGERSRQLGEAADASLALIQETLTGLLRDEEDLRRQSAQFPALESQLDELQAQSSLERETYQYILSQLQQAGITRAAAAPYVEILDPATDSFARETRGRINVVLGGLLGLILGVGAAFFLEYLDRTVRTSADVESLLGIPVLGVIPRLRRLDEVADESHQLAGRGLPLVVAMDPLDPAAEAYRNLRMNITFMSSEADPIRTVLFSSPGPSEGKSTTAVNFAVMLAQQGQRVLMIDADLRRPSLHRALDVLREPGLTNLLIGDIDAREAVRPNVLPNLDFLPSGPFPPNPSELLNSKAMARVIEEFEGRYDQVVIDSPPVLAVTDAAVLAIHTDGAVLVLRSGETEQRAAERAVDQLRRLGVRVFGAVLNEVSAADPDDSYYLQYYYSYHPTGTPTGSGWQRLREGLGKVRFFG